MSNQEQEIPNIFTLHKLGPSELTDYQSHIYCEGRFYPVSIAGVKAGEYGRPVFRLSAPDIEIAQGATS